MEKKLYEVADELQKAIIEVAPEAWDATLAVTRANAVNELITPVMWLLFFLVVMYLFHRLFTFIVEETAKEIDEDVETWTEIEKHDSDITGVMIGWWISMGGGTLLSMIPISNILDVWIWIGIFNPKLRIAHEILNKFL